MEASGALAGGVGAAGSAGAEGAAGAEGGEAGQQQQTGGFDPAPILARFDQIDTTFDQRFQALEDQVGQLSPQQQQQLQQDGGDLELYLNDQGGLEDANGNPVDPNNLGNLGQPQGPAGFPPEVIQGLRNGLSQEMQQQLAPILETFQDQQAERLMDEFPPLRDDAYAEKLVGQAEQFAEAHNAPGLAKNPAFVRLLHLAEIGAGQQGEGGAQTAAGGSETEVQLETGGVTNAGGQGGDLESHVDSVIGQRASRRSIFDG